MELELLAKAVDDYAAKREERLAADKVAKALKKEESALEKQLLERMVAAGIGSLGGSTCRVTKQVSRKPQVVDWPAFYAYMHANNAPELLQRRLNEGSVAERSEDGELPGIDYYEKMTLSVSKL